MHKTGTLSVSPGVSKLDGTRLAQQNAANPFGAANNLIASHGLAGGDFIWVEGSDGTVGTVPVIFITDAGLAGNALVLLPGSQFKGKRVGTKGRTSSKKSRTRGSKIPVEKS